MSEHGITIQRRLTWPTLFFCWLFFFLIPVLLFDFALTQLFSVTRQAGSRAAVDSLINEMNRFRKDVGVTQWLNSELAEFFALHENKIAAMSARRFANFITTNTGLETFATITHKADTADIDAEVDKRIAGGNLPIVFTRRFLVGFNRQADYQFYSADENRRIAFFLRTSGSQERFYQEPLTYLRNQFDLIADIPLHEKKVIKAISGRVGANVYFYYWPVRTTNASGTFIDAGCFLAVKTPDLRSVFINALQKVSTGFVRSITHLTEPLPDTGPGGPPLETINDKLTRFYEDDAGAHLVSTFDQVELVDIVQRGGFYPEHLDSVLNRMPLLRVTVPLDRFNHPLNRYHSEIRIAGLVFVLFGLVFALYSYLFGVDFRLRIRQKVLVGIMVMLLFPVMTLFAGYATWAEFSELQAEYGRRDKLLNYLEDVQAEFDSFLVTLQHNILLLGKQLSQARKAGIANAGLVPIMQEWVDKSYAESVYIERKEGILEVFSEANEGEIDEEGWFRRAISRFVFNLISKETDGVRPVADNGKEIAQSANSGLVNEIINSWGRLMVYERFGGNYRYGMVNSDPGQGALKVFVTAKYSNVGIVNNFVRQLYQQKHELVYANWLDFYSLEQNVDGHSYYKIEMSKTGTGKVTRQLVTDAELLWNLESAADGNGFSWHDEQGNMNSVKAFTDFPLIAIARHSLGSSGVASYGGLISLFLYAVTLTIFTMIVFGLAYLSPIAELMRVMKQTSLGNYDETIAIGSHDEFAQLGEAFTDMIYGVRQREQLARFVSEDVIDAVESDSDEGMAPGGVKVDATIVFVELSDLQQMTKNADVEEVLRLLGDFIARADRIASTHGGVLDKVIENTLMLVFRAKPEMQYHALVASRAALELAAEMNQGGYKLKTGIASGEVVSGKIGSRRGKLDYTVIGDTVNLAARLKVEAAGARETGIVIAPGTIRMLKGLARLSFIRRTEVKGKSRAYPIYELLALREPRRAE